MRVAVIGAGLAGLACARTLVGQGHAVAIFDKGRSPGGRATSRREPGERIFDHGAQFFTARGAWLTHHVALWEREGVVARWSPRVHAVPGSTGAEAAGRVARARDTSTWWVGTPRMGALAAHLAAGLDLRLGAVVSAVTRVDGVWQLAVAEGDATSVHHAEALVVAVPAAQCATLLAPLLAPGGLLLPAVASSPAVAGWSSILDSRAQTPCWAVMAALRNTPDPGADVIEDATGPIAWAAREGSKPGRVVPAGEELWTLHASTAWSQAHLEDTPESVAEALTASFVGAHLPGASVVHTRAHRWRYARGVSPVATGDVLFDPSSGLAVCGDWLAAPRVESALESGVAAADRILGAAPPGR